MLLLDEPTNDLDTDTLAALEDLLDSWPGTLIVVSHDRYLVERVCDDVRPVRRRPPPAARRRRPVPRDPAGVGYPDRPPTAAAAKDFSAAEQRQAKKDLARIEQQLTKLTARIDRLHDQMAAAASDYARPRLSCRPT